MAQSAINIRRLASTLLAILSVAGIGALPPQIVGGKSHPADSSVVNQPDASSGKRASLRATIENAPLQFIENRGQLDARVLYHVQAGDTTVYFTTQGVTFALAGLRQVARASGLVLPNLVKTPAASRWTVKLDFVAANPHARLVGQQPTQTRISYFIGRRDQWRTGLRSFGKLVYENLWPGIDLVYSGNGNRLKYEFVIRPGADPHRIKLAYRGATSVSLNSSGDLEVVTPLGGFQDDKPYSYQEVNGRRVEIATAFALEPKADEDRHIYGFRIASFDERKALVIDPVMLIFSGYIGGSGNDRALGITVGGDGGAYITGGTTSDALTFPVNAGPSFGGVQDAFVARLNPSGTGFIYCAYIGGADDDVGFDIAVDSDGSAYITGTTRSTESSFPVIGGPDLNQNGGGFDAFVAKVDASGTSLVYCGYIGGAGVDGGVGIALDSERNAYITGGTTSNEATFPVRTGPDLTYNGGLLFGDAFVAKVSGSGRGLVYCGYIGGTSEDSGIGIAVDSDGNAYIAGGTNSTEASFPVSAGPDTSYNGGVRDGFVAKVNATGTALDYCGYIGGASGDTCFRIAVDGAGNAYVAGETSSRESTFPVRVGPDKSYNGGTFLGDGFVAKVNHSGAELIYCGYIGGAGVDIAIDIAVDANGNAYITGGTTSGEGTFPLREGPDLTFNGGSFSGDAFVAKVNQTGSALDYCGYIGGDGDDLGYSIAVDGAGNAYVAGETGSAASSFPVLVGPASTYRGSIRDGFVAKLRFNASPVCSRARASIEMIWPPNHNLMAVSILGVSDPDGDPVTIRIDRILQDEPTNRLGDGDACPDAQGVGTSTAQLRAERNGNGNGRVYTIFFTATDGRGESCQGSVKVCVPHNKNAACVDEGPAFNSTVCSQDNRSVCSQRRFSTSIRSSKEASTRVKRIVRPSAVAVKPASTLPRPRATVVDRRVAKSKNWSRVSPAGWSM
jgi:hypothetical protein